MNVWDSFKVRRSVYIWYVVDNEIKTVFFFHSTDLTVVVGITTMSCTFRCQFKSKRQGPQLVHKIQQNKRINVVFVLHQILFKWFIDFLGDKCRSWKFWSGFWFLWLFNKAHTDIQWSRFTNDNNFLHEHFQPK